MNIATEERPILFNAAMVHALLDGSKTQTRRLVKPRIISSGLPNDNHHKFNGHALVHKDASGTSVYPVKPCQYGQPGDRLWVREAFAIVPRTAYSQSTGVHQSIKPDCDHDAAIFKAGWDRSAGGIRWRPSIHMPRWASHIQLEIVDVRIERLKNISEENAKAEGVIQEQITPAVKRTAYSEFLNLWISIYGGDSWDSNPWVWVVEFKRIT